MHAALLILPAVLLATAIGGCSQTGCRQAPEFRLATAQEYPALTREHESQWSRTIPAYVRAGEDRPGVDYLYLEDGRGGYRQSNWLIGVDYNAH
ncbi:MAG: hypothetical protein Q7P63_01065 [Verrucomicrobiota bacterium JB022]|nr:hypothetical protein [Verrucomicrobiota bacterium JB022]